MWYAPSMISFSRTRARNSGQCGLDSIDHEFIERAFEPHQALAAGLAVDDQLADQGVVIRRNRIAVIDGGIDAHAKPPGG